RDVVVEVVVAAASAGADRRGSALHRRGAAEIAAAAHLAGLVVGVVGAAAAAAAVEDRELAPEALQHDLGRVLLLAGLVLPFAGLQLALDVDLRALAQVLLGDPRQVLVEDHDVVPLGALLALAGGLVLPVLRGC